jgi:hypothetical protein
VTLTCDLSEAKLIVRLTILKMMVCVANMYLR